MKLTSQFSMALRYLRAQPSKTSWAKWVVPMLLLLVTTAWWSLEHFYSQYGKVYGFFYTRVGVVTASFWLSVGRYISVTVTGLVWVWRLLRWRSSLFPTVSAFGLFLGTTALITVLAVERGFEKIIIDGFLQTEAHVQITAAAGGWLPASPTLIQRIRRIPGVRSVIPFVRADVLLSRDEEARNAQPVVVKGIDLSSEADLTHNTRYGTMHWQWLRTPSEVPSLDPHVTSKRGLLWNTQLRSFGWTEVGDEALLISPTGNITPDGAAPALKRFRVVGLFVQETNLAALVSLSELQNMLGDRKHERLSGIEVDGVSADNAERLAQTIREALSGEPVQVTSWQQKNQGLFSALDLERRGGFAGLSLILLVAAFSIVANGLMWVAEKEREIAILKTMGATDRTILGVFLWMGLWMGAVGSTLGALAGVGLSHLVNHYGLPVNAVVKDATGQLMLHPTWQDVVQVLGTSWGLSLLATLYPAWLAARQRPITGLRL